jgi:hypothetical protein
LFHRGVPSLASRLSDPPAWARLSRGEEPGLSPAGARAVAVALGRIDDLDAQITPLRRQIASFARRQPGCQASGQP